MKTKEGIKNEIARRLHLTLEETPPMSTGSTEPKRIFELVDERLNLSIDPEKRLAKTELAKAIVIKSGQEWREDCESTGGTVTKIGLIKVLFAVSYFAQNLVLKAGPFAPADLGVENDYTSLNVGNTGAAYECAIAALLMPPRQLEQFMDITIPRMGPKVRSKFDDSFRSINIEPANTHCFPGLPKTDDERYVECTFQDDRVGPADIVVHDLRTRHAHIGVSVKHKNLNIKNPSPAGLGLSEGFEDRQNLELRRITPEWVEEMRREYGDLAYPPGGKHNWSHRQSVVVLDFYDRVGREVMREFNDKAIEERLRLTRSLLHLEHNPLQKYFIVKTNERRNRGVFIQNIIREREMNFSLADPKMGSIPNSRVKKRISDESGGEPIGIDVQVKCNNGFVEHKKRDGRRFSEQDLIQNPSKYFSVTSGRDAYVLKYGSLNSWDVTVGQRPSPDFWEFLYEATQ